MRLFIIRSTWKKFAALQRQVDWPTAAVVIFLFCNSGRVAKMHRSY